MILYHGSNQIVSEIDLSKCRPYRDFGTGFYLTLFPEQAKHMAVRTARLYGGDPVTSVFEYRDDPAGLHIRTFEKPSVEWARFVMNNRDRSFVDFSSLECNLDNKYDVVIGPVANDDMALLFRQYADNLISLDTLARGMEYRELTSQYSFHTEAATDRLKFRSAL